MVCDGLWWSLMVSNYRLLRFIMFPSLRVSRSVGGGTGLVVEITTLRQFNAPFKSCFTKPDWSKSQLLKNWLTEFSTARNRIAWISSPQNLIRWILSSSKSDWLNSEHEETWLVELPACQNMTERQLGRKNIGLTIDVFFHLWPATSAHTHTNLFYFVWPSLPSREIMQKKF